VSRPIRRSPGQLALGPRVRFILLLLVVAFAGWLLVPVPALTASVPPAVRPAAQPGLPWLSVNRAQIVDDQGRAVILRGFNDDALLETTVHPSPLDATDARLMQASGFNVVRLPIAWSLLEPHKGVFDSAYVDRIATAVRLLTAHGLYVVFDMHFLGWSPVYGGSGAPAWATVGGIPDPVWGPMPSLERFMSPAINVSTAYFWFSSDWQDHYLAAWRLVAQRFRGDSGVAGYDLINEPHAFPLAPIRFDKDQLFPFYARAIESIGGTDPNHLFFIDNDMVGDLPTSIVPLTAPNLVYAPHVYTGALIPPEFMGDAQPLKVHVDELATEATAVPAALWFGEFSINIDHGYSHEWINTILDDFDRHNAGWAWWQWRETSGWGIRSADGKTLDTTLLRLLARPYVAAAPEGVRMSYADSARSKLVVDVSAQHGPGAIALAWPLYTAGTPRMTSSCGAPSVWDAATARLVVNVPVATSCSLRVAAG
jgi:endoglycosylceramidase